MMMTTRHHLMGSGCVPHTITMTKRWGPVGFMRVGGMGLGDVPSPVGFPDFASYQTAVISSFAPCPPPFDPVCENPRDAAISQALAQWTLNPQSCANVVCDSGGQPLITPAPSGSGSGYNTTTGFVPVSTSGPSYTPASPARHIPYIPRPLPYGPPQPSVVNPSPTTLLTTTGSSSTAPSSVVSQANGTAAVPGATASTVGGFVPVAGCPSGMQMDQSGNCVLPQSTQLLPGIPNWVLFVAGGAALLFLTSRK